MSVNRSIQGSNIPVKANRRVVLTITMLVVASFLMVFLAVKTHELSEIKAERVELNKRLDTLQKSQAVLEEEIKKLKNPDYVANLARKDYYLSKKEEYIFRTK